ncbi:hypothetical protein FA95DRAFT_1558289 [Auriscalpium vulgare]|uniref:Uncharacterized protein n=1 Tax=Auriscalpium vulgare TaxID=40419 RepID=A0ACB8RWF4_9AGAM|nr:hypothetical protein FA95DRAFT_1558289 [Auriscalpium vulgare]
MIVAFGPTNNSYYLNNGRLSKWSNLPNDLAVLLKQDPRFTPDKIESLCLFPNNGYFLVAANSWASSKVPAPIQRRIDAIGGSGIVRSLDFNGKNFESFILATRSDAIHHQNLPQGLRDKFVTYSLCNVGYFAIGADSSWALATYQPAFNACSGNLGDDIKKFLAATETIYTAYLSPYDTRHGYVIYRNASVSWCVPDEWGDEALRSTLPTTTFPAPSIAETGLIFRLSVSFGPPHEESYHVENGMDCRWSLPPSLSRLLQNDARFRQDNILSLSLFPQGGYLLTTLTDYAAVNVPPSIDRCITAAGGINNIIALSFDGQSLEACPTIILTKDLRLVHQYLPPDFFESVISDIFRGFKWMCLGAHGAWAYGTRNPPLPRCSMVHDAVREQLNDSRGVQDAFLSPYTPHAVVVYNGGGMRYYIPRGNLWNALAEVVPASTSRTGSAAVEELSQKWLDMYQSQSGPAVSSPPSSGYGSGYTSPSTGAYPWASPPPPYTPPSKPESHHSGLETAQHYVEIGHTAVDAGNTALDAVNLGVNFFNTASVIAGGCVVQ